MESITQGYTMTNLYNVYSNVLKVNSIPLTLSDATILKTLWSELELDELVTLEEITQ